MDSPHTPPLFVRLGGRPEILTPEPVDEVSDDGTEELDAIPGRPEKVGRMDPGQEGTGGGALGAPARRGAPLAPGRRDSDLPALLHADGLRRRPPGGGRPPFPLPRFRPRGRLRVLVRPVSGQRDAAPGLMGDGLPGHLMALGMSSLPRTGARFQRQRSQPGRTFDRGSKTARVFGGSIGKNGLRAGGDVDHLAQPQDAPRNGAGRSPSRPTAPPRSGG